MLSTQKKKRKENILWGLPGAQWLGLDPSTAEAEVQSLVRKVRSQATQPKKKRKERTRNCAKILVLTAPGQPHGHAQLDGIPERESASLVQMASLTCLLPREHMCTGDTCRMWNLTALDQSSPCSVNVPGTPLDPLNMVTGW